MSASLDGVKAKIERAKGYFVDLENLIREWIAIPENQIAASTVIDHPEGKQTFATAALTPIPVIFSLAIGDFVHNLRSALDHLAWQLVIASPPNSPGRETAFPIWITNTPKQAANRLKLLGLFRPDIVIAINSYQPYQRSASNPASDPLHILSELDNIDKHRLLLVVLPDVPFSLIVTTSGVSTKIEPKDLTKKDKDGKIIASALFPPLKLDPKSHTHVQAEHRILFKDTGLCCDGERVLPTLKGLINEVEVIVSDFSRFF